MPNKINSNNPYLIGKNTRHPKEMKSIFLFNKISGHRTPSRTHLISIPSKVKTHEFNKQRLFLFIRATISNNQGQTPHTSRNVIKTSSQRTHNYSKVVDSPRSGHTRNFWIMEMLISHQSCNQRGIVTNLQMKLINMSIQTLHRWLINKSMIDKEWSTTIGRRSLLHSMVGYKTSLMACKCRVTSTIILVVCLNNIILITIISKWTHSLRSQSRPFPNKLRTTTHLIYKTSSSHNC